MTSDILDQIDRYFTPPTTESIEREKRQQDEVVIAVRRLLAKNQPKLKLFLYNAA